MSQAATAPEVTATGRGSRRRIVLSLVLTQLMIVLDMTIVVIALPHLQADLGITDAQRSWVVTAYSLAFGGLVLFGGRLTVLLGMRRSYRIGQLGFAAASLAAGLAPSFAVLVTARALQGMFAALLAPTNLALVNAVFIEKRERDRIFGVFGATAGLGAAAGLLIGGALTDWLSWRWSLYINVGIVACSLLVGSRHLPARGKGDGVGRVGDDLVGLLLGCGACFSVVFGLDRAEQGGWRTTATIAWLVAGAVLAVAFIARERLAASPVLPLWLPSDATRAGAYASQFIMGAAQMGSFIALTYYVQQHLGYSPVTAGLAFLPLSAALIITAVMAGQFLVPRLGAGGMIPLGFAVQAVSFIILSRVAVDSSFVSIALPGTIVFGIGMGLVNPVTFNAGTHRVPERHIGLASALLSAAQQIGGSFGVALLTTYASRTGHDYAASHADAVRATGVRELMEAGATPDSPQGQAIIARLTAGLADASRIHAYSSSFTLLACIVTGSAVIMVVAVLALRRRRGR